MLLVVTALFNRLLRVRDGDAGRLEWAGIGVAVLFGAVISRCKPGRLHLICGMPDATCDPQFISDIRCIVGSFEKRS